MAAIRTSLENINKTLPMSEEEVLSETHKLAAMESNLAGARTVLARSAAKGEEAERVGRDVARLIFG